MKVADNLHMHKISDEFQFGKMVLLTLEFLEYKKTHIRLCPEHIGCVIFIQSLWNLQIKRTDIKYATNWKLDHIALFTLELHALDCWHFGSQLSDRSPLGYLFFFISQPSEIEFHNALHEYIINKYVEQIIRTNTDVIMRVDCIWCKLTVVAFHC